MGQPTFRNKPKPGHCVRGKQVVVPNYALSPSSGVDLCGQVRRQVPARYWWDPRYPPKEHRLYQEWSHREFVSIFSLDLTIICVLPVFC